MARDDVTILGLAELENRVKGITRELRKGLKTTHAEIAKIVERTSKPTAPRRSGNLASTVRSSGTQKSAVVRAGSAQAPYANPIHWGWFRHGIKPNSWVLRAARSTEPEWLGVYSDGLQDLIDRS